MARDSRFPEKFSPAPRPQMTNYLVNAEQHWPTSGLKSLDFSRFPLQPIDAHNYTFLKI